MPSPRAVLFDFDYTLADSSEAVVECFNAGLAGIGLPPAAPDAIRRTIGLTLPDSLAQVAGEAHRARSDEFRRHWRELSDRIMVRKTRLLPPVRGAVADLRGRGVRLGVVSTKWRCRIEETFARDRLTNSFEVIVGGDDVASHKPDPEGIRLALKRLEVSPAEALYVGDSIVDAEAAERAGVPFAAVLSGMTEEAAFGAFRRAAILEHMGLLPDWLSSLVVTRT